MKLKDLFAFKDWLSYRQRVGLLVTAGVVCGLGGLFMYLLRAHTYFIGDNPSACVNCHIMTPYYATWSHSSHGRIDNHSNGATCNDCHVPHQNLAVYYGFKAVDGLKHTAYFVGHMEHQAIKAETLTGQVVMDNCIRCHEQPSTDTTMPFQCPTTAPRQRLRPPSDLTCRSLTQTSSASCRR